MESLKQLSETSEKDIPIAGILLEAIEKAKVDHQEEIPIDIGQNREGIKL